MRAALFMMMLFHAAIAFAAEPLKLYGIDHLGKPCYLVVEEWGFKPDHRQDWSNFRMKVRTSWMIEKHPPLEVTKSPTPGAFYGHDTISGDQIAIFFEREIPNPAYIRSFLFQSTSTGKLFQARCDLIRPKE